MRKITILSLVAAVALLSMLVGSVSFAKEEADNTMGDSGSLYKSSDYEPDRYQILNINNLWTWTRCDGISNHSPLGDNGLYFPRGTAWLIYTDGFMWGGKCYTDAAMTEPAPFGQTIRVGGTNYITGGREGRIIGTGGSAYPADPDFARIYRIRRDYASMSEEELQLDAAESNETSISSITSVEMDEIYDRYELDWNEWPVDLGAPFIDRNGDGVYTAPPPFSATFTVDDLIAGGHDEPGIAGADPNSPADQVVWTVYNDLDMEQTLMLQGSYPMGLELQLTVWGYKRTGPMGDLFFRRIKIINKGGVDTDGDGTVDGSFWVDSMYVAQWSDPDLGSAGDDLLGCDTLSMGFVYNGNAIDLEYNGFGLPPPSAGYDFLQGPIIPSPGDSAVFDLRRIYGYKNLPMTSFSWFSAGSPLSDPPRDYTGTLLWYKMLRGYVPLDGPDEYYPFPPGVTPGPFPLSGDPVAGTGLLDGLGTYWSFAPGDRRMNCSTGPFTLAPGDTQEVVVALVCGLGADRLSSISMMKYNDRFAQSTYDRLFSPLTIVGLHPITQSTGLDQQVSLIWQDNAESYQYFGYTLQGYNIYQLSDPVVGPNTTMTRIATFDVIDNITTIWDYIYDPNYNAYIEAPVQYGTDSGLQHFFQISINHVNGASLNNLETYYFAVTAYAYNPDGFPKTLESTTLPIEVTPVGPVIGTDYSEVVADSSAAHIAGGSDGSVIVTVVDPSQVTGHDYRVTFEEDENTGELIWTLTDTTTGEIKLSGMPQLASLDDLSVPVVDGLLIQVLGPPKDFKSFQMVINGAGPLDPPESAAAPWAGFPCPTGVDPDGYPTDGQQVGEGKWLFHTGDNGTRGSYAKFKERSCRGDNFSRLVPYDWEMRFTAGGSYSFKGYEDDSIVEVPFELWCIGMGTPDDPSDDYRLIPLLLEDIGGVVNNEYDLSFWGADLEHSVSGGDNDPFTDWVYWEQPVFMTPGESGYDAYVASLDLTAMAMGANSYDFVGLEVLARTVLVNWNGGSAPPFNQNLPEEGSVIRLLTTKPTTTDDVFEFNTTAPTLFDIAKGDVNDDGSIDVVDVVMIINFILQIEEPTGEQEYAADFNNDLQVNIADVVGIINDILGLSKTLAKTTGVNPVQMGFPAQAPLKDAVVSLPLEMISDESIAGMQIELSYDPLQLKPLSLSFKSDEWSSLSIVQNTVEEGKVIYLFYSLGGKTLPISDLPVFKFEIIAENNGLVSDITLAKAVVADSRGNSMEINFGNRVASTSIQPRAYALYQNYPNPFNPVTTIRYDLPIASRVTIQIYNVLGQRVRTLLDREESAGRHHIQWDGRNNSGYELSTGIYFMRFKANDFIRHQKMLLVK